MGETAIVFGWSYGKWHGAELRADRSENQQTWLRRGVVMASPKLADLLLPAWVGRLRVKARVC